MGISRQEYLNLVNRANKSKQAKYKNVRCEADGYKFGSKKEREYFLKLKLLQEQKRIKYFLRQVPLHLSPKVTYRIDFLVVHNDGSIEYIEVKGYLTDTAKAKINWAMEKFDINVKIV